MKSVNDTSSYKYVVSEGIKFVIHTLRYKYVDFKGRANRTELLYFHFLAKVHSVLFTAFLAISVLAYASGNIPILLIFLTLTFLPLLLIIPPSVALVTRRLHDTGRSGWWQLIVFIPLIGWIILIIFTLSKGDEGDNKYGPPPQESKQTAF